MRGVGGARRVDNTPYERRHGENRVRRDGQGAGDVMWSGRGDDDSCESGCAGLLLRRGGVKSRPSSAGKFAIGYEGRGNH